MGLWTYKIYKLWTTFWGFYWVLATNLIRNFECTVFCSSWWYTPIFRVHNHQDNIPLSVSYRNFWFSVRRRMGNLAMTGIFVCFLFAVSLTAFLGSIRTWFVVQHNLGIPRTRLGLGNRIFALPESLHVRKAESALERAFLCVGINYKKLSVTRTKYECRKPYVVLEQYCIYLSVFGLFSFWKKI